MTNDYNFEFEENFDTVHFEEVRRFEEGLQKGTPAFMDIPVIDEVYLYYQFKNQYPSAHKLVDQALQWYPNHAAFYHYKAELFSMEEQNGEALEQIEKALSIEPHSLAFIVEKANILAAMGQNDQALLLLLAEQEACEEPAMLLYEMGKICQRADNHLRAVDYFEQAFRAAPEYDYMIPEIVFSLELADKLEDGVALYKRLIDEHPYNASLWYHLGQSYHKLELFELAIEAYDFALVIEEDEPLYYLNKGSALMDLGKFDQAIPVFLNARIRGAYELQALLYLAECYLELGETEQARTYYRQTTDLDPNLSEGWYGMGATLEQETRYYEAIFYFKKTIELDRNHLDAWLGLAESEYYLGNEVSAFEALKEAIDLSPTDLEIWGDWAHRLAEDGKEAVALELLEEGLRRNPRAADLMYQYSAYAFKTGHSRQAFTLLENALILAPQQHVALFEFYPALEQLKPVQDMIRQYSGR